MFRYDTANTGYNPNATGPKASIETAWRYSACTEADWQVVSSNGRIHAGDGVVNAHTGERIGETGSDLSGNPTVVEETIYVIGNGLIACDAETGVEQWQWEPQSDGRGAIQTIPTITTETVYVPATDATLYAVDASTGTERWQFDTAGRIETTPAVDDGVIYVVDTTNTLYAVAAETGEERWRASQNVDCWRSIPAVVNDHLFLGSMDGSIRAVNTADGAVDWEQASEKDDQIDEAIAATDGTVVGTTAGTVVALDAATGRIEWRQTTDAYKLGAPIIAGDTVYVGESPRSIGGNVFAFDVADGTKRWQFETRNVDFGDYTRSGITHEPIVLDGVAYIATATGDLYALIDG